MLTGILIVRMYTQVDYEGFDYDIFLVWWTQVQMPLSTLRLLFKYVPSQMCLTLYYRLDTLCLRIYHQYHDTL